MFVRYASENQALDFRFVDASAIFGLDLAGKVSTLDLLMDPTENAVEDRFSKPNEKPVRALSGVALRAVSGEPGPGRPKGMLNKTSHEVRAAARALVDDPEYRATLAVRLKNGLAPHMETLLWHYAYGKPVERIEVKDTTNEFEGVTVEQLRERARLLIQRVPSHPVEQSSVIDVVPEA